MPLEHVTRITCNKYVLSCLFTPTEIISEQNVGYADMDTEDFVVVLAVYSMVSLTRLFLSFTLKHAKITKLFSLTMCLRAMLIFKLQSYFVSLLLSYLVKTTLMTKILQKY